MRRTLCAALLLAAGCAGGHQTLSLDVGYRADAFLSCKNHEELYLAAEALFDALKCTAYLGADLKQQGAIPIVLYANNRSSASYLLLPSDVTLILTDGSQLGPETASTVCARLDADGPMRLDFLAKDFFRGRKGVRLGAENDAVGVVFFRVPAGKRITDLTDAVLKLHLTREKGQGRAESEKVKVILSLE